MKKQIVWSFIGTFVVMIAALVLVLAACSKKDESTTQPVNSGILKYLPVQNTCFAEYDLMAGQTADWGAVNVWTDDVNLYVDFFVDQTIPDLTISQIHVWVGLTVNGYPKNSQGVPQPGLFPVNITFDPTVSEYKVTYPLANIPLIPDVDCLADPSKKIYIMAHAVMSDGITTQTAWGGDLGCMQIVKKAKPNDSGRWYYEIGFCADLYYKCDCDDDYDVICTPETAFGGANDAIIFKPGNQAWFYYYDVVDPPTLQTVWATNEEIEIGSLIYDPANNGTFHITLNDPWVVNDVAYPDDFVKIKGYYDIPHNRPNAGQGNMILFGTLDPEGINDPATGLPFTYYVVHVDVMTCEQVPVTP